MQRIHYIAGLPRSGSTLLVNLLGQCPGHTVGPTSGLVDLVAGVRDGWPKNTSFQSMGLDVARPRVERALRGLITGYYATDLLAGRIVFDKSRGWPAYTEVLDAVFEEPQKIVLTLRDVRAVLASFEKLHRKNPLVRHGHTGDAFFRAQTTEGRAQALLAPTGVVGLAINRIRDLFQRGLGGRAVVIPYRTLTQAPGPTLQALHVALKLPTAYEYDPDNVTQLTREDDDLHGWGDLHTVRNRVEAPREQPWQDVLPERFAQQVAEEYADINALAQGSPSAPNRDGPVPQG